MEDRPSPVSPPQAPVIVGTAGITMEMAVAVVVVVCVGVVEWRL
jgi:hypothetical protein